jgi:hypothetical protein
MAGVWLDVALLLTVSDLDKIKYKSFCFSLRWPSSSSYTYLPVCKPDI